MFRGGLEIASAVRQAGPGQMILEARVRIYESQPARALLASTAVLVLPGLGTRLEEN